MVIGRFDFIDRVQLVRVSFLRDRGNVNDMG